MKNRKTVILSLFLVLALLLGGVIGCAPKEEAPAVLGEPAAPAEPVIEVQKWRLQHAWSAAENYYYEYFADVVYEMTAGQIDIAVFADAQLIPREDIPKALKLGTLDMAHSSPSQYKGDVPATTVDRIPFMWENMDEFHTLFRRFGLLDLYRELLNEELGMQILGQGSCDMCTTIWAEDFSSLADLAGRTNSSSGPVAEFWQLYDVSPVYIAVGDLYTSVALGIIDGISYGGAQCAVDMGTFEVAKYYQLPYMPIGFSVSYYISPKLWDSLSTATQAILRGATNTAYLYMRTTFVRGEEEALRMLVNDFGGKVVTLPDEDIQAIRDFGIEYLAGLTEQFPDPGTAKAVEIAYDFWRVLGKVD